jgi:antitoxin HicB
MKKTKNKFKYEVDIFWSEEDDAYVANVPELPGCSTHGDSLEAAAVNAQEAIAGYLETLKRLRKPIPVPLSEKHFSGEFLVRVDPSFHRDLMIQAQMAKTSLNKLVIARLKR